MGTDRALRVGRTGVFAAVCVLLSATGHAAMPGPPLPWWALGAAVATVAALAWPLTRKERGLAGVTATAVLVQAGLHTCFSLAQAVTLRPPADRASPSLVRQWAAYLLCSDSRALPSEGGTAALVNRAGLGGQLHEPSTGGYGHTGHAVSGMADAAAQGAGHTPGIYHDMAGMSPAGMLAAHLLAALLSGLWLGHGERTAFRLLRAVAGLRHHLVPLGLLLVQRQPPPRPPRPVPATRYVRQPRHLLLTCVITSRGPPGGSAVGAR